MSEVVDSHVHLLPERLGRAIRDFFAANHHDPSTFCYPLDHDVVCARLAADGVGTAWSLPYARRAGTASALNVAMAEVVAAQAAGPVVVVGGATVHPGDDDPVAVVRAGVEDLGLRVLKLHCSVGGYRPDDARLDGVWAYVSDIALPVVVHVGHATSGHSQPDEVAAIGVVADRWPQARLVVAHCGHPATTAALDLVEAHPWVFVDLTPVVIDPVDAPLDRLGRLAERVLFGTDAPNTAIPASACLARLDGLGRGGAAWSAITGGTARALQRAVRT